MCCDHATCCPCCIALTAIGGGLRAGMFHVRCLNYGYWPLALPFSMAASPDCSCCPNIYLSFTWNCSVVHGEDPTFVSPACIPTSYTCCLQLHGSGSQLCASFLRHAMATMTERSRVPIDMSYRVVGTAEAQTEFAGAAMTSPALWAGLALPCGYFFLCLALCAIC